MRAEQLDTAQPDKNEPGPLAIAAFLGAFVLGAGLAVYGVWAFWPTQEALEDGKTVHFLGFSRMVSADGLIFVIVALAGALGGLMHAVRSFVWYCGNKQLKWAWIPWNLVMPVLGAGLGTVVYLVVRGGFFQGSDAKAVNPFAFAGLAALVGLFTEQAMEMLRKVADQVFASAPKGADSIESAAADETEVDAAAADVAETDAAEAVAATTEAAAETPAEGGHPQPGREP